MIPLFSPGYLQSPTAEGVVSNATASLFISEGRALSEKIEQQSQKSEAQAKAPAISTIYADAFTRLSQGDISAFGDLERANGLAAGNPFLMSMAKDAQRTAGQMTANFFETQQQKLRFENQQTLQDKSFENQQTLQDKSFENQGALQEKNLNYYKGRDKGVAERQQEDDIRGLYSKAVQTNEAETQAYNEAVAANQELQSAGMSPQAMPPKPKPVKSYEEFKLEMGFNSKTSGDGFVNESPKLPNGKTASLIEGDNGLFGIRPPEIPATTDSTQAAPQETAQAQSTVQPAPQQQAQSGPTKKETVEFGGMQVEIAVPAQSGVEGTRQIKTPTGYVNVKLNKGESPASLLAKSLQTAASDKPFSDWIGEQRAAGKEVVIRPEEVNKKIVWQPYSINSDKSETQWGKTGPDGKPSGAGQTVTEEVGKAYNVAKALMQSEAKGTFQLKPVEKNQQSMTGNPTIDEELKKETEALNAKYGNGKVPIEEQQAALNRIMQKNRTPEKVLSRAEDEVRKELGEVSTSEKKQAEEEKAQKEKTVKNAEKLNELQGEYDRLTEIVKSGKFKKEGGFTPFVQSMTWVPPQGDEKKEAIIKRLAELKVEMEKLK